NTQVVNGEYRNFRVANLLKNLMWRHVKNNEYRTDEYRISNEGRWVGYFGVISPFEWVSEMLFLSPKTLKRQF
ncbi:MAG: hypothetical protein WCR52_21095, partial [Bacteroidota bacterium]